MKYLSLKLSRIKSFEIIIITNKSGLEESFYKDKEFHLFLKHLSNKFYQFNIKITDYFFFPHDPIQGLGKYKKIVFAKNLIKV